MATDRPAESERAQQTGTRSATVTRAAWISILCLTGAFHLFRGAPLDALIFFGGALVLTADALGWLAFVPLNRERRIRRVLIAVLMAVALLVLALAPLYGGVETVVVVAIGIALMPIVWPQPATPGSEGATGWGSEVGSRVVRRRCGGARLGSRRVLHGQAVARSRICLPAAFGPRRPVHRLPDRQGRSHRALASRRLRAHPEREVDMTRIVTIAGFIACGVAILVLALTSRREGSRMASFGELLDGVMQDRAARVTIVLFWWWIGWHFLVTPPLAA